MGCGKTHWGRHLSQRLNLPFYDLDDMITEKFGKNISAIFDEKGEAAFRALEREMLQMLGGNPPAIVATGGGTPCFFDNMDWMNENGLTIYLKTAPTLLMDRLRQEKAFRPLLADIQDRDLQDFIEKKIAERSIYYSQSQVILNQDRSDDSFLDRLENEVLNY